MEMLNQKNPLKLKNKKILCYLFGFCADKM